MVKKLILSKSSVKVKTKKDIIYHRIWQILITLLLFFFFIKKIWEPQKIKLSVAKQNFIKQKKLSKKL